MNGRLERIVFRPGTTVELHDKLTALVTGVALYGTAADVEYRVVWWDGRQRKEEWLRSDEVEYGKTGPELRIGFHADGE